MNPRSSQRRAPLRISPNSATPTSSTTPAAYRGGPTFDSRCGGTLAINTITASASPMLTRWPLMRTGLCPEALVTTARLMPSTSNASVSRMLSTWRRPRRSQWLVRGIASSLQFHVTGAFPGQVVIEDRTRNRCRRGAAMAAVLDHDRHHDGGVLGRRIGNEQRMVTILPGQAAGVIAGALLDADLLRGAGFACDCVGRAGSCGRNQTTKPQHNQQTQPYHSQILRLDRQMFEYHHRLRLPGMRERIAHRLHLSRFDPLSAIGKHGGRGRQLQR